MDLRCDFWARIWNTVSWSLISREDCNAHDNACAIVHLVPRPRVLLSGLQDTIMVMEVIDHVLMVTILLRIDTNRHFKIYNGKPWRRRLSNKRICEICFNNINLNTVLVLYTTPLWAFSSLQDDGELAERRELFLKTDINTDITK